MSSGSPDQILKFQASYPPPPFEFSFKLLLPKNNSITSLDNIDDRMMINFILR